MKKLELRKMKHFKNLEDFGIYKNSHDKSIRAVYRAEKNRRIFTYGRRNPYLDKLFRPSKKDTSTGVKYYWLEVER